MVIFQLNKRNVKKAEEYLLKLEQVLNEKKDLLIIDSKFYPYIYLKAGRYFYGRNKFLKAKEIFEKGLKYVPENQELQKMLKWTKEDMKN